MIKEFKTYIIVFVIMMVFISIEVVKAGNITSPPALEKDQTALSLYLQEIHDNFNRVEFTTTNPDGSRNGKKGDLLILSSGTTFYLQANTDSATQWRGIALSNTP